MTQIEALEAAALAAHRRGQTWREFWDVNGTRVIDAAPINLDRFRRLRDRLLSIVVAGDVGGAEPIDADPAPWIVDDEAHKPADVGTAARCPEDLRALTRRPVSAQRTTDATR